MKEEDTALLPEILNVTKLAGLLGVTNQTIVRYINEGRLPGYKVVPGRYLVTREKLIGFINDNSK
jgi:excisionase family DNA binding protein